MSRRFLQVDVFSPHALGGNPLAVVIDGEGLTAEQMQQFTRWTNLSEAAFLSPPTSDEADYRVRIFTQAAELPFAGHPTLGSCHAWLQSGGAPRDGAVVVQECGSGLVPLRHTPHGLAFRAPPPVRQGPVGDKDLAHVRATLGIDVGDIVDAAWTDNGPGWVSVLLRDARAVLGVRPRTVVDRPTDIGVVGRYPDGAPEAIEVRAFFTDQHLNLLEDPVTGSLNAAVGQWLIDRGHLSAPYTASQGTALGRTGRPHVTLHDGSVWVAGATTTHVTGTVLL